MLRGKCGQFGLTHEESSSQRSEGLGGFASQVRTLLAKSRVLFPLRPGALGRRWEAGSVELCLPGHSTQHARCTVDAQF